ncbi:MAG: ABC transporter ATP-binding protein [Desulfurivibrionaceae bacterium]
MMTAEKDIDDNMVISGQSLYKIYEKGPQKIKVLDGIDIYLRRGEMTAIIGASGTGKSTLLNLLGTLDRPCGGSLFYEGEDIYQRSDSRLAEFRNKTIGFVFQFHHLLPEFTALENTIMPGLIGGCEKKELVIKGQEILNKVGLEGRHEHRVGELSGGEQQRVALARALIRKPALLLADEPTGDLDPKTGDKVFALIKKMNQDFGLTTVIVTHNHHLARQMDRCLTLENGKLVKADL